MNITYARKIGGCVIWILKGCRTNLKEEIRDDSWLYWVVGFLAVFAFVGLSILWVGYFYYD